MSPAASPPILQLAPFAPRNHHDASANLVCYSLPCHDALRVNSLRSNSTLPGCDFSRSLYANSDSVRLTWHMPSRWHIVYERGSRRPRATGVSGLPSNHPPAPPAYESKNHIDREKAGCTPCLFSVYVTGTVLLSHSAALSPRHFLRCGFRLCVTGTVLLSHSATLSPRHSLRRGFR